MGDNLRVYISSTYSDLRVYREAVQSTLRRFGFIAVALEEFGEIDALPIGASMKALENSDIVVLLLAHRLGHVPSGETKSIVELEYDRALMMGKPILPFVLDNNFPWPPAQIDVDNRRIEAFRELLMQDRIVSIFTTPNDLSVKVGTAISQYSRQVEGISLGPPEPEAPSEEVTLANVVEELKGMRTDVSVLQQSVLELTRRPYSDSANYGSESFLSPADFLGVAASIMNPQRCFVIMPYSEQWSGAVERILLEICSEVGLEFSIAKNMEGRFIPNDIWRGITGAGIIVADLSGANPNVTYEVGLADVIGRDVILIGQEAKVPFDFLGQRLILYQDSLSGTLALREELTDRLKRYKLNLTSGDDSITN